MDAPCDQYEQPESQRDKEQLALPVEKEHEPGADYQPATDEDLHFQEITPRGRGNVPFWIDCCRRR